MIEIQKVPAQFKGLKKKKITRKKYFALENSYAKQQSENLHQCALKKKLREMKFCFEFMRNLLEMILAWQTLFQLKTFIKFETFL